MPKPLALLLLAVPALAVPPRTEAELRTFFVRTCAACHGRDGSAVSPEGLKLKGMNFTSAADMKGVTDAEMAGAIRKGLLFGLKMPSFKDQLSEEEIATMVRIIRGVQKGRDVAADH